MSGRPARILNTRTTPCASSTGNTPRAAACLHAAQHKPGRKSRHAGARKTKAPTAGLMDQQQPPTSQFTRLLTLPACEAGGLPSTTSGQECLTSATSREQWPSLSPSVLPPQAGHTADACPA
ncbi:hypothetical protein MHYP_G00132800 [Metynnis hypsauchen]